MNTTPTITPVSMPAPPDYAARLMLRRLMNEGEKPRPASLERATDRAVLIVGYLRCVDALPTEPDHAAGLLHFLTNPGSSRTPVYRQLLTAAINHPVMRRVLATV